MNNLQWAIDCVSLSIFFDDVCLEIFLTLITFCLTTYFAVTNVLMQVHKNKINLNTLSCRFLFHHSIVNQFQQSHFQILPFCFNLLPLKQVIIIVYSVIKIENLCICLFGMLSIDYNANIKITFSYRYWSFEIWCQTLI